MNDTVMLLAYAFEGFRLDAQHRVLSRASGESIPVAPKVFDLLLHFVERPGQLITKRALLEAIWPHVIVEENNLNQVISGLRRVLGETRDEHRFIVTEPGRGYRFVASVEIVPAISEVRVASRLSSGESSPKGAFHRKWSRRAVGASVSVALAGLAIAAVLVSTTFGSGDFWRRVRPIEYDVGKSRRLTLESVLDLDLALSPDGRYIAFHSFRNATCS